MAWKLTNEYQQKTLKKDAVRVASALNRAKITCLLEREVVRFGQFKNGHPMSYWMDILLIDSRYETVDIEMEGEGSSSKDNSERDAYLKSLGIIVLHFKNSTKSQSIIDMLNESFRRKKFP